jgi:ferrous iron transport protein A
MPAMGTLNELKAGHAAKVVRILADGALAEGLEEAGLTVGSEVEVLARGPLGGSPVSVRLGRAVLALRRDEAAAIEVS